MILESFLKLIGVVAIIKNLYFVFSDLGDQFRVSDYEDNCISNSEKKNRALYVLTFVGHSHVLVEH